ncbi:hypothetical protein KSP40_PGU007020 [Platanthera guangdongensis]|uniref:Ribosomal protein L2 n=1 Tax=Platanthera guangdongensis TaxID=2320717 RepID=A0ABR2MZT3_9ASPA
MAFLTHHSLHASADLTSSLLLHPHLSLINRKSSIRRRLGKRGPYYGLQNSRGALNLRTSPSPHTSSLTTYSSISIYFYSESIIYLTLDCEINDERVGEAILDGEDFEGGAGSLAGRGR